jgi:hypothetical protein
MSDVYEDLRAKAAGVYLEGRKTQQHRLEQLVKNHLSSISGDNAQTELEKVLVLIVGQFIDSVKDEAKSISGFESIYLK